MCGSMNLARAPNPTSYERTNYLRVLQSWQALRHAGVYVEPEATTVRYS